MIFSLTVYGAPFSNQCSDTAYQFASSLLKQGHSLHRVFFYHDGVYNGSVLATPPQDERNIQASWSQLAQQYDLDLVVCVAAGLRRGMLDETEADRYEQPAHNLASGFTLSGLGQMVEAAMVSDRMITFGA
ncbi:MAG: sulfurtransferase complex subunit TusD [Pseudomonadales bacterium]|nr:sulfurtransferase complex subunit TusD [Pseudomonadales bacterium]